MEEDIYRGLYEDNDSNDLYTIKNRAKRRHNNHKEYKIYYIIIIFSKYFYRNIKKESFTAFFLYLICDLDHIFVILIFPFFKNSSINKLHLERDLDVPT